jgi:hypothetical protein
MKSVVIVLGEKKYTIEELARRKNAAWRERLEETLKPLVEILQAAPNVNIQNLDDVSALVSNASGLLLGSIDRIVEALLAYSPQLERDSEWIGENCYDSEIVEAFTKILTLAFPFDSLVAAFRSPLPTSGSNRRAMLTNSAAASGESGVMS